MGKKIDKISDFSPNVNLSDECINTLNEADSLVGSFDIYNIYGPLCFSSNLTTKPKRASLFHFDPCSDYYVYAYLNTPEVQKALHANVTKLDHDWEPCGSLPWNDSVSTVVPLLREFMKNGFRVWTFSGDNDGRVPVTSTQYSINFMKLPTKSKWRAWILDEELGGYTQEYKGDLTFATERGAGHEVPSFEPRRALTLIKSFLAGTPLCSA